MSNRIIRNLPDSKYKAVVGNTLAAINYDATGTTFLIEYTM